MKQTELIAACRYYKGEKKDPYDKKDPNKSMLWTLERSWTFDTSSSSEAGDLTEIQSEMLSYYIRAGLRTFEQYDDTPLTLKALLFYKYSDGIANAEDFKKFYLKYYK